MAAPLSVCTKEEQLLVIWFLWSEGVSGPQSIKDFQHNMGTVFCHNGVSMNGLKNSKMVAQVLRMRKEPDDHPRPQIDRKSVV
jgi:hypothetical protein